MNDGFTMVELVVVMTILAILMAVAIPSYRGIKDSSRKREASFAASQYAQAISSFMADNGNRVPRCSEMYPINTTGTPTCDPNNISHGPANLANKPYMTGAPDSVSSGQTQICMQSVAPDPTTCTASPTALAQVTYTPVTNGPGAWNSYSLKVSTRSKTSAPFTVYCYAGNSIPAAGTKC